MSNISIYALLSSGALFELLVWHPKLHKLQRQLAAAALVLVSASTILTLKLLPITLFSLLFVIIFLYRVVNIARVISARIEAQYLRAVAIRTMLVLYILQLILLICMQNSMRIAVQERSIILFIGCLQLFAALILLASTIRTKWKTKVLSKPLQQADKDLPTVTVAIPARDETGDLQACLDSLISNDYPKLEIMVLDDCSITKRTSEIIRDYANKGVIFVPGKEPPKNWVPKNYAYQQLFDSANGELVLFCGVDVRFERQSIRQVVGVLQARNKLMASIAPVTTLTPHYSYKDLFIQPSRYAWEFTLPRRSVQRPPVLSPLWLIKTDLLKSSGGFNAVCHSNSPESYFARLAIQQDDGYSFIRSDRSLGITSQKRYAEQRLTAIRLRYPQLHRRIELVALLSFAEAVTLLLPIFFFIVMSTQSSLVLALPFGLTAITLFIIFYMILRITYDKPPLLSVFLMPLVAAYDIILLNYSMYAYEFGGVIWKGRNICLPVLQTYPRLPKIK